MAKKSAAGSGSIRKRTLNKNGKQYTYWEARYSAGRDPGTGKQIQRSISGKTQKEVSQKLKSITSSLDDGTYVAPCKLTVGQWLDIWTSEYLSSVKPRTADLYKGVVNARIKPGIGALKLDALTPHVIQTYCNDLSREGLAPKTVKNIHGILHKTLQQAVINGYIRNNPADSTVLPRVSRRDIKPLDEEQISIFLKTIQGHEYCDLFTVTLFTGMREGEALGLLWDCVDFENGTIKVDKQLQLIRGSRGQYQMVPTKNSKSRTITLAPSVVKILRDIKHKQLENKMLYGAAWKNSGFVFTNDLGHHLFASTVYKSFKRVMEEIGSPETRFHDLRHSYAVASIRSGDDIKTVQDNLGHATAAFTLDVYGHVTQQMKQDSANRMEQFIKEVSA